VKKLLFLLTIATAIGASSCKKQKLSNEVYFGTFKGKLAYADESGRYVSINKGTAVISGNKNNYTITFNNSVPKIEGVAFEKTASSTYQVTKTKNAGSGGIVVTDETLRVSIIGYRGSTWSFLGKK
jgi:hypothetical protein